MRTHRNSWRAASGNGFFRCTPVWGGLRRLVATGGVLRAPIKARVFRPSPSPSLKGRGVLLGTLSLIAMGAGLICLGCNSDVGTLLPAEESGPAQAGNLTFVVRLAQVSDTHVMDTLSPARFPGASVLVGSAWRPQEAYATQILDGMVRTINRIHASGRTIGFVLHTGDACDNNQSNELGWLVGVLDGEMVNPLSGPDDRTADARPDATHDPYAAFGAQGLYRRGVHGDQPSVPWYIVLGNHDAYALGAFPVFESSDGRRTAPLPLDERPGLVLPVRMDPEASFAYGNVTPAAPGPPALFELPRYVVPNSERRYFNKAEYVEKMFATVAGPPGHGFADALPGATWYSTVPAAGVRLIGLDTTAAAMHAEGGIYNEGALSWEQHEFLRAELDAAQARDELVIVATHHPSGDLSLAAGTAVFPDELRGRLRQCPNVVLHLVGHTHRNRVTDQGGYLEIETCSTLDWPQEGRLIEVWRDAAVGSVVVTYEMFSHLDESLPPLGADPLHDLRRTAADLARGGRSGSAPQKRDDSSADNPAGAAADRAGAATLSQGGVH